MNRRELFKVVLAGAVAPFIPVPKVVQPVGGIDAASFKFWLGCGEFDIIDVTRIDVFDKYEYKWEFIDGVSE